jgi:hypothetical protein
VLTYVAARGCSSAGFAGSATFGSTTLTSTGGNDVFVARIGAAGAVDWAVRFGASDDDQGYAITADGSGGSFVAGIYRDTVAFGATSLTCAGNSDIFVVHIDSSGAVQWAVSAGGTGGDVARGIATDGSGGVIVAARCHALAKLGTAATYAIYASAHALDVCVRVASAAFKMSPRSVLRRLRRHHL